MKVERGNHGPVPADRSVGDQYGVAIFDIIRNAGARVAQAVGVALAVAEFQRVDGDRRQLDAIISAVVEQHVETLRCADP